MVAQGFDERSALQNFTNYLPLDADTTAMNDSEGPHSEAVRFREIFFHYGFNITW
jgi:hypothetical protein